MRARKRLGARILGAVVLVTVVLASILYWRGEPLVIFPGRQLDGDVTEAPEVWAFTDRIDTIQLETTPEEPYSVNLWGVGIAGSFYVSGNERSKWVKNLARDSRVRLRVHSTVYQLHATRVDDSAERDSVVKKYVEKYSVDPVDNFVVRCPIFRLSAK